MVGYLLSTNRKSFAFVVDAGEDRVVCMGGNTTLGGNPTALNPDNSLMTFTYSWQPTTGLDCANCPNPTLSNASESQNYTLTVVDTGGFTCTEAVLIEVTSVSVFELSFSGEDNHTIVKDNDEMEYTAPHWKDNSSPLDGDADDSPVDIKYPVCYESGKKLEVSAIFKTGLLTLPSITPIPIRVRGSCSDGITIPSTEASYNNLLRTIEVSNALSTPLASSKVNYYAPFEIEWEISFDGGITWCSAGVTKNPLYVTLGKPIQPYKPPKYDGKEISEVKLFHTLVHNGCILAKENNNKESVLNSVWSDFENNEVRRIDGFQLTYYANYQCTSGTTNTLLATGDGQCGAWTRFFLDILKAQGINYSMEYITIAVNPSLTDGAQFMFIKEWKIAIEAYAQLILGDG
ncbi:MAG: hypothetical protein ACPGVB_09560 [Chitinophagales bacterium]